MSFHLQRSKAADGFARFDVELDATQPYLSDHRPGGEPLFGTTMGIAVMREAVEAVEAELSNAPFELSNAPFELSNAPFELSNIELISPIILADQSVAHAVVLVESRPTSYIVSVSTGGDDRPIVHCRAMFGPSPVAVDSALPLGSGGWRWSATGADVYRCFFHGPAFQVIGRCALVDDQMWSEMSAAVMPLWSADTPDSQSDAHAIELGLQTAGLLELAMDRRMMIPKRIGRIAHGPGRLGPGSRAMARRASVSVATSSFTIDVVDSSGSPILVIHDYETQPLPFASDAHAVHTLAALLSTSPTAAP